nr:hypothetical protein [uncultured Cohaesibacter sp.]
MTSLNEFDVSFAPEIPLTIAGTGRQIAKDDEFLINLVLAIQASLIGLLQDINLFGGHDHYLRYLRIYHQFCQHLQPAYLSPSLQPHFDEIDNGPLVTALAWDLSDLTGNPPPDVRPIQPSLAAANASTALGWILVAEVVEAFSPLLCARANLIGFDQNFGAIHLHRNTREAQARWRRVFVAAQKVIGADCKHSELREAVFQALHRLKLLMVATA